MKRIHAVFSISFLILAYCANATNTTLLSSTYAFQNGEVVRLLYFSNYACTPPASIVFNNSSNSLNASDITSCEMGSSEGVNYTNAIPSYNIVPAFANFSIYGYVGNSSIITNYGVSPEGYLIYNFSVIQTHCNAALLNNTCLYKPAYLYSPFYLELQQSIGASNGINGLPRGVMTNPERDIIVPPVKNSTPTLSDKVVVWVFDPNIFPNATTGLCHQIAPSDLSNPIENCLNSTESLQEALNTNNSAVAQINSKNSIWKISGSSLRQAIIPILTEDGNFSYRSDLNSPNTNIFSYSCINTIPLVTNETESVSENASQAAKANASRYIYEISAIILISISCILYLLNRSKNGQNSNKQHKLEKELPAKLKDEKRSKNDRDLNKLHKLEKERLMRLKDEI